MFTLCGLILEARENLFQNFWSPFSISFYFSSTRNNKKNEPTYGPCPTRTLARLGNMSRPSPPGETLAAASPALEPHAAAARPHALRRRRHAPPPPDAAAAAEVRRRLDFRAIGFLKKNRSVFVGFSVGFFSFGF